MLHAARNLLFTGLEWLVLYHLWESFPRLRRLPRLLWVLAGAALLTANFGFHPIKRHFYPLPDAPWLWSFLYRVYVTCYFLIGGAAVGVGLVLLLHYGLLLFARRRARADQKLPETPGQDPVLGRRAFLSYGVAGGLSLATGVSSWAVATSEKKDLRLRRVRVPLPAEHRGLAGLRIAQITDFHVGPFLQGPELERMLTKAASLGADLIVHTGDHFNSEKEYEAEGAEPLALLSAPHGLYAVPGNHDRYFGVERFTQIFREKGFHVLRAGGDAVPGVSGLVLHGINDPPEKFPKHFAEVETLGRALDRSKYNLLLTHRPDAFPQAAKAGFDLCLAGHTHGGQVHLRLPGGIDLSPARLAHFWDWGLFGREGRLMYVSSGLGYAGPPVRMFCPPEIALIELVPPGQGEPARAG